MDVGGLLKDEEDVKTATFRRSANTDNVLRYVTYLIFGLQPLILNYNLYSEEEEWSELLQYVPDRDQRPKVLQNLSGSVVSVLKVTPPLPPYRNVIELNKDGL